MAGMKAGETSVVPAPPILVGGLVALAVALVATSGLAAQLAPKPPAFQHVTVVGSASHAAVAKGGTVTLLADVTPRAGVHVYAVNAHGFTPVKLVLTPNAYITPGRVTLPPAELAPTLGVSEPVPAYRKTFRIAQPVTIAASAVSGETLRIAGAVNYQACDDRLCYPAASVPIAWSVAIR